MEEEDEDRKDRPRPNLAAFSSLNQRAVQSLEEGVVVRQQASSESNDVNTCSSISTAQYSDRSFVSKTSTFSRSGTSSSSQDECEVAHTTVTSGQYLAAARVETARSMESLRPNKDAPSPARPASSCTSVRAHRSSFLTASERDVRDVRGLGPARRALSGEDMGNAEKRRGLFASTERRALQQLSLPPPERRLTILSPHSPMAHTELQWPSPPGIRGRRKKGMVLPKLILPRSDSDGSEVFFERLEDFDKLFGPLISAPETVYKITLPEPQNFRDVTSNTAMPSVTAEDINVFCQLTEREDISTSENMYNDYFLMSCRIATINSENTVTAMVASEMRKNIIYNVAINLRNHLILEAQCECAAGMGPYSQCKHVLVVLFGIIDFTKHKSMKLRASSTSNLQTFHQPNMRHTGDPVKAADLKLKFSDQTYKRMTRFDPRQVAECSSKYTERFKNMIANFCAQNPSTTHMPIAQLIKSADKETSCSDHDYLIKTSAETFLESRILTSEQRAALEENTRMNRKLWKRERLLRLHSYHYGRICKCKNAKKSLAKQLTKNSDVVTAAIKHGLKYEPEAVQRFEQITGLNTQVCGIIVHPTSQFLASTPDRLVGDSELLEVKCPFTAKNKKITPESVNYLYQCEQTGLLKLDEHHNYFYQIQGQLLCTGRKRAYFCIYTLTDIEIVIVDRDDDFIKEMYLQLKSFYEQYFKCEMLQKFFYNKKV